MLDRQTGHMVKRLQTEWTVKPLLVPAVHVASYLVLSLSLPLSASLYIHLQLRLLNSLLLTVLKKMPPLTILCYCLE